MSYEHNKEIHSSDSIKLCTIIIGCPGCFFFSIKSASFPFYLKEKLFRFSKWVHLLNLDKPFSRYNDLKVEDFDYFSSSFGWKSCIIFGTKIAKNKTFFVIYHNSAKQITIVQNLAWYCVLWIYWNKRIFFWLLI